ncbi:hypothetical protein [Enterococcus phage IMEEF1]|uniref:Uncharacterized protein n=1 Tax=Enterococcus phage IMEEF1 TaxID=1351735 RepID=S5M8Q0_9CAUD|nr:hypothetical protein FDH83_gp53 [Enterococcus phage IMEEF1]AGR49036.1 hypothetical protein [Enterococcus phage IMEEF1]
MDLTNLSPEELTAMIAALDYVWNHDLEEKVIEEFMENEFTEEGENFPKMFDERHFEKAQGTLIDKAYNESILVDSHDFDDFDDTYSCGCCMCCGCTCDNYMWEDDGSFDDDDWGDDD